MNDIDIAKKYVNKASNAAQKGHEFDLTFTEFKRVVTAKRCYYTGIELTSGKSVDNGDADVTIDRVDSSLGYVKGNVVACCHAFNQLKGRLEQESFLLTQKHVLRGLKREQQFLSKTR